MHNRHFLSAQSSARRYRHEPRYDRLYFVRYRTELTPGPALNLVLLPANVVDGREVIAAETV